MELYNCHRPTSPDQLIGQKEAVEAIRAMFKRGLPHVLLFTGPSGTGKTTTARILKAKLKCSDTDFEEINAADTKGIDTIREVRANKGLAAWVGGGCRIYLFDEAHKLTNDAQTALLKILEDTHEHAHVYFILCTTDEKKLIPTVRNRCTIVRFKAVDEAGLRALVNQVATKEKVKLDDAVVIKIAEAAGGSPRAALTILQSVMDLPTKEQQLKTITQGDLDVVAFDLVKALVPFSGRPNWNSVAKVLTGLEDLEDPEGLRRLVMAVAYKNMLKGDNDLCRRSHYVIECFRDPIFDVKAAGRALLAANCKNAVNGFK